jgi:hypothetical protein
MADKTIRRRLPDLGNATLAPDDDRRRSSKRSTLNSELL